MKKIGFGLGFVSVVTILFYFLKNTSTHPETKQVDIKIGAYRDTNVEWYSGRVVRYDMQPVSDAILYFDNGIAKTTTNSKGEFRVDLPKNIVNTSVDLSIRVDDKEVYGHKILVNEQILKLLKVK